MGDSCELSSEAMWRTKLITILKQNDVGWILAHANGKPEYEL